MKIITIILMILYLTGCSIPNEQFDCKYDVGVGCKSITRVNKMVDVGSVGNKVLATPMVILKNLAKSKHKAMNVQRITEEHLRVWIAPYQDDKGYFHEGAVLHAVLRPGFWQVQSEI